MVKKLRSMAEKQAAQAAALFDNQLAQSVKESAQQIWLAGMGAFSRAQAEGGKVFEHLVKEGMNLQRRTQNAAEEKVSEVTGRMTAMADSVTAKAGQNWDRLEAIFEQRTAKALNKLGVPTTKDIEALIQRVDELAAAVARLSKSAPAAAPARGAKAGTAAKPPRTVKEVKATKAAEAAPAKKAPAKRSRKAAAA